MKMITVRLEEFDRDKVTDAANIVGVSMQEFCFEAIMTNVAFVLDNKRMFIEKETKKLA